MTNEQPEKSKGLEHDVLTVNEVADYMRVSRVTAWRWCKDGVIPAFRIGGRWRIHKVDLFQCLEEAKARAANLPNLPEGLSEEQLVLLLPELVSN